MKPPKIFTDVEGIPLNAFTNGQQNKQNSAAVVEVQRADKIYRTSQAQHFGERELVRLLSGHDRQKKAYKTVTVTEKTY